MKNIFGGVIILAAALLILAVGVALVVLAVSGIGQVVKLWLPYSLFEASLLSLLGLFGVVYILRGVLQWAQPPRTLDSSEMDDEDYDDEDEGDVDDVDNEEDEFNGSDFVPSILRWRQPLSSRKYKGVGRNDPCPCGSGKKFKYCHGRNVGTHA